MKIAKSYFFAIWFLEISNAVIFVRIVGTALDVLLNFDIFEIVLLLWLSVSIILFVQ